jgi:hypothetical protein
MGEVGVNAAEVRALAQRVLDGADALDDVGWPTDTADDLAGSAIAATVATTGLEARVADVAAAMRAWAAATSSATAGLQHADERHAGRLQAPR